MIEVIQIDKKLTYPWLLEKHYAKRIPPIQYAFALVVDNEIQGVVTYGTSASPQIANSIVGAENRLLVLELNRLCLHTEIQNAASMLVSRSLRMLPSGKVIVSYADGKMGHVGIIYQACNFKYCGPATAHDCEYIIDGQNVHPRTLASRGITSPKRWAKEHNIQTVHPEPKQRYLFITGSKSDRKKLYKLIKWDVGLPYPKSETRRYDAGPKLTTDLVTLNKPSIQETFAGLA